MRKRDQRNPRHYKGKVNFSREPLDLKVWSYKNAKSVDYYVAFVDVKTHTLCSGKFRVRAEEKR